MRIAINIRLWLPDRLDGIGHFTAETTRRMVLAHPEHEFFLLCDRHVDLRWPLPPNAHQITLFPPARHPLLWALFFELAVPRALRKHGIDLFLSTDGWMSLRTKVPTLTVMHDINFEHADDYLRPSHQRYMKRFFPRFARKASRVATVSEFSRKDIAHTYGLPPSKIDVVYDGANDAYQPLPPQEQQLTRSRYADGLPFFLFVGASNKRKNLANTLLAFDRHRDATRHRTLLLVAGAKTWTQGEVANALSTMRHRQDVRLLGHVSTLELTRLMASAEALLYVSRFEGFGIPILEAFQAETPVVTSSVTSIPEVAGDAALTASPDDPDGIARAMTLLSTDDALRSTLVARGRQRSRLFSWGRTAALLWDSLLRTAKEKSSNM